MHLLFFFLIWVLLGLAPVVLPAHAATLSKEPALQENFYGVHISDNLSWIVGYLLEVLSAETLSVYRAFFTILE